MELLVLILGALFMAELTKENRDGLASKKFVFEKERRYPIHDRSHGANALARVSQHGTPAEKKRVKAKVCAEYPDMKSCKKKKKNKSKYKEPLG